MKSLQKSYAILISLCLTQPVWAQELPAIDLPPLPSFDEAPAGLPPLPGVEAPVNNEVTLPAIEVVSEQESDLPELPSFDNIVEAAPIEVAPMTDAELPAIVLPMETEPVVAEQNTPTAPALPEIQDLASDDPFADPDFDALFDDDKKDEQPKVQPPAGLPGLPPLPGQQAAGDSPVALPPIGLPALPGQAPQIDTTEKPVETAAPKKAKTHKKRRNFSYKVQRQPKRAASYQRSYNRDNRHLPVAAYETDIDHSVFLAAAHNDVNGLRSLLNAGRRMDMRNPQGDTPLITAVRANAMKTARLLVARGADVHAENRYGMSAIDVARQQRNEAALTLLSPLVFAQR